MAECFWPDVRESDLQALDERAHESATALSHVGSSVDYLGSLLVRDDEVVLCLFGGAADAVREAAVRAGVPFERILAAALSPWLSTRTSEREKEIRCAGTTS